MHVKISGKIRDEKGFKKELHTFRDRNGQGGYDEYFFNDVRLTDDHDGDFHVEIESLAGKIPGQIPQQAILGFSIHNSLEGNHRLRGIYKFDDAEAVVGGVEHFVVTVNGPSIEGVRRLYCRIRAGTILPVDNWEAEQVKPRFLQRLSFALRYILFR